MNKTFFLFFYLFSIFSGAQNLVPNNNFENFSQCPYQPNQIHFLSNWKSISTPDFFSACGLNGHCGSLGFKTPRNCLGFEFPRSGNSYIGLYSYDKRIANKREFVFIELKDTLKKDLFYRVTYFLSLADTSMYALKSMGVVVTDFNPELVSINDVINYESIYNNNYHSIFSGWEKNTFIYEALGNEIYLIIGSFVVDSIQDVILVNNSTNLPGSFYYIDDVSLVRVYSRNLGITTLYKDTLCYGVTDSLIVGIKNEGLDTINFLTDSLRIETEVSISGVVVQSFSEIINDNQLNSQVGQPLLPDSSFQISIKSIDFSQLNQAHSIKISIFFSGDEDSTNNVLDTVIVPQLSIGNTAISNTVVCTGTTINLSADSFLGSPVWQFSSDSTNWNSFAYTANATHQPDSTTFYRFSVCEELFSSVFKVEVIRPQIEPKTWQFCASGIKELAPFVSLDVKEVNWYNSALDSVPFYSGFVYETTIKESQNYYVEALIDSCFSSAELKIIIGGCSLIIPNIFTPNGDGINDVFLYGNAEGKNLETKIFNRWGEKVMEWKGNSGWDGHGAHDGVYYYLIKADGEVFRGTVTLVR